MHRTSLMLTACLLVAAAPTPASAQSRDQVLPVSARLTPGEALIAGTVRDDAGVGLAGASVLAMGTSLAVARTDDRGRFALHLPPGNYVLRAVREGYISTYRETLRLVADDPQRRVITLARPEAPSQPGLQLASVAGATEAPVQAPPPAVTTPGGDSSHSETAWRLRHLPRTVLRDEAGPALWDDDAIDAALERVSLTTSPARAAASFLAASDFTGHVDFLTTSSLSASGPLVPVEWPRGVASVVFGAPVGDRGDWIVRAALTAGDLTSWTLLGEYQARADRTHAFRAGVAYSAQAFAADPAATTPTTAATLATLPISRRVGGVYVADRWTMTRGLEADYGVRLDRYDYLAEPNLVSGTLGLRASVAPRTTLVASVAPHMIAPGADQFVPPATAGVWLPPERSFSSLRSDDLLRPEAVVRYDVVLETRLRSADDSPVIRAGRFTEVVTNQIATLFGLPDAGGTGHYFISSPGDLRVDGWVVGLGGPVSKYLQGAVDYRATRADWIGPGSARLHRSAPSAARRGTETGHDLTTSLQGTVPATATHFSVAYRFNSRFAGPLRDTPIPAGRYTVEVAQQLPFRPLGRGELNLLLSARTLLHELGEGTAYFDELLTVNPPLRITCGLQMRF
ncbi:MAG: TonB-dependent receptor [Acidobacteriota bacterium]